MTGECKVDKILLYNMVRSCCRSIFAPHSGLTVWQISFSVSRADLLFAPDGIYLMQW